MSQLKLTYKNNLWTTVIIIVLLQVASHNAKAEDPISNNDIDNSLYIDSETLTINKLENTAVFQGSVVVHFEDLVLYTSEVRVIYKTEDSEHKPSSNSQVNSKAQIDNTAKIEKIIIPNKLEAIKEKDDEILIANEGEYIWDEGKLILIGDVKIMHQENVLKTKKLVYYTAFKKLNLHEEE